jgi:hypothetical protein
MGWSWNRSDAERPSNARHGPTLRLCLICMGGEPQGCRRFSGLTLMEIVASLLLCGLLFGFVISSFNHHRQVFRRSTLMQQAIDQSDRLVARWYMQRGRDSGPRIGSGRFEGNEPMVWQVVPVATEPQLSDLGIVKYRLEVRSEDLLLVQLELLGSEARPSGANNQDRK